jgi:nucleoside-diphosphate-sugar epimerase
MTQSTTPAIPDVIRNVEELEELLSRPSQAAVHALEQTGGDIIFLGAAGKMGPTLACMARRASELAGVRRRIWAVSRFSSPETRQRLQSHGVETIQADLLHSESLGSLPDAANVIYMVGMKFGTSGNEALTWATNTWLPSQVARRYATSRIVAFSTGNVYGAVPIATGGSHESDLLQPRGEYAMSCLGRERMFEYFSRTLGTQIVLVRLNYAVETRYGVLLDLALKVRNGAEIDISMGHVNVIWQGDAAAMTLAALADAASPPWVVNVTGREILSVREVCQQFGRLFGKPVRLIGWESNEALLSNSDMAHRRYGQPQVDVQQMIRWIAHWVESGEPTWNKPTHFEQQDGRF